VTLVIGVGNPWRRDDAAGLVVADAAGGARHEGDATGLVERWAGAAHVVVVDAAASGAPPGTVRRFVVGEDPLPFAALRSSTHAFGVGDAIELGRALGRLPARMEVYAIEGGDFSAGAGLTPEVERAARALAAQLGLSARRDRTGGR
jgi:hydrogenase maturation protease